MTETLGWCNTIDERITISKTARVVIYAAIIIALLTVWVAKAYSDTYPPEVEVREPKKVHIPIEEIEIPEEVEEEPKVEEPKKVTVLPVSDCYTAMRQVWPENLWENASLVITKESGGRSDAVSSTNDHGCFQIHGGLQTYGNKIYDADFNVRLAYGHYYLNRGWTPWMAVKGILW